MNRKTRHVQRAADDERSICWKTTEIPADIGRPQSETFDPAPSAQASQTRFQAPADDLPNRSRYRKDPRDIGLAAGSADADLDRHGRTGEPHFWHRDGYEIRRAHAHRHSSAPDRNRKALMTPNK